MYLSGAILIAGDVSFLRTVTSRAPLFAFEKGNTTQDRLSKIQLVW